jgi:predicted phage-related endonuclease
LSDGGQKPLTLGVSNFAAAAGVCTYTSRAQLWRYKTGRAVREITPWMTQGKQNEFRAVTAVEIQTGLWFENTGEGEQVRYEHLTDWALLVAYPDGVDGDTGLEVKCPRKLYSEVPVIYQIQMAGQFMVCGFSRIIFGAWSPAETRMWEVRPNRKLEDALFPKLKEWAEYIHSDTEPPRLARRPKLPELITERIG